MNTCNKWVDQKCNVAPEDVVLLVYPSNLRGKWPLEGVQEAFKGPDGDVRVVRRQVCRKGIRKANNKVVCVTILKSIKEQD